MRYEFTQKTSEKDFLAFYNHNLKTNILSPIKIIATVAVIIGLLSGFFWGNLVFGYFGIAIIVIYVLFIIRVKRSGTKIFQGDPEAFTYKFELDDITVTFRTKDGSSTKTWKEFITVIQDGEYLFLYTKTRKGLVFVKNKIEPEIWNFIQSKIQK